MHNRPFAATSAGYDWSRFGRHRLRAPAGVLIDSPLGFQAHGWLGTLWPGDGEAGGWARMLWQADPAHGGWLIPRRLAGADVLEFGADQACQVVRWYGIVDCYDAVEWLTVQGPYAEPGAAHAHAQQLLAGLRYRPSREVLPARTPCMRPRASRS
jgi:hypothetical protein